MNTWLMRRLVTQAGVAGDDGAQQLVGVQAALHQQLGLALPHELHRLGRRGMAVRRIDDPRAPNRDAAPPGHVFDPGGGADENGRNQALLAGLERPDQRR